MTRVPLPPDAHWRRTEAHKGGRHGTPQVDCYLCWRSGAFAPPRADTDGLLHRGQHADCQTCRTFREAEAEDQRTGMCAGCDRPRPMYVLNEADHLCEDCRP